MSFWSDIMAGLSGFTNTEDALNTTEPTAAPQNINTMNYGITAKSLTDLPKEDLLPIKVLEEPPEEVQSVISNIFNTLNDAQKGIQTNTDPTSNFITTLDISERNGHTLVKITEDFTGETIEVLYESTVNISSTEISPTFPSTTVKNVSQTFIDTLNDTKNKFLNDESVGEESNYVNAYVIAALVLIGLIGLCLGGIIWCKSGKTRAIRRNSGEYHVSQFKNDIMNNKMTMGEEKHKNIP